MFYFKCNITNEEGTICKICVNGINLDVNGLCVESDHCIKGKNEVCKKCEKKDNDYFNFCLNSNFGCVETSIENCLECDDILDFNKCTKCMNDFELNSNNQCHG